LVENLDVRNFSLPDPIAPAGIATNDVEVVKLGVLRTLHGREVFGQQLHAASVRSIHIETCGWCRVSGE